MKIGRILLLVVILLVSFKVALALVTCEESTLNTCSGTQLFKELNVDCSTACAVALAVAGQSGCWVEGPPDPAYGNVECFCRLGSITAGTANPGGVCTYEPCAGVTCYAHGWCETNTGATCNPATGSCEYPAAGSGYVCSDTDSCTGTAASPDYCIGAKGGTKSCAPGADVVCDSGNTAKCEKTTGSCGIGGSCTYPPDTNALCDDGNKCTKNDKCTSGFDCVGTLVQCDPPQCNKFTGCEDDSTCIFEPVPGGPCDGSVTSPLAGVGNVAVTGTCTSTGTCGVTCEEVQNQFGVIGDICIVGSTTPTCDGTITIASDTVGKGTKRCCLGQCVAPTGLNFSVDLLHYWLPDEGVGTQGVEVVATKRGECEDRENCFLDITAGTPGIIEVPKLDTVKNIAGASGVGPLNVGDPAIVGASYYRSSTKEYSITIPAEAESVEGEMISYTAWWGEWISIEVFLDDVSFHTFTTNVGQGAAAGAEIWDLVHNHTFTKDTKDKGEATLKIVATAYAQASQAYIVSINITFDYGEADVVTVSGCKIEGKHYVFGLSPDHFPNIVTSPFDTTTKTTGWTPYNTFLLNPFFADSPVYPVKSPGAYMYTVNYDKNQTFCEESNCNANPPITGVPVGVWDSTAGLCCGDDPYGTGRSYTLQAGYPTPLSPRCSCDNDSTVKECPDFFDTNDSIGSVCYDHVVLGANPHAAKYVVTNTTSDNPDMGETACMYCAKGENSVPYVSFPFDPDTSDYIVGQYGGKEDDAGTNRLVYRDWGTAVSSCCGDDLNDCMRTNDDGSWLCMDFYGKAITDDGTPIGNGVSGGDSPAAEAEEGCDSPMSNCASTTPVVLDQDSLSSVEERSIIRYANTTWIWSPAHLGPGFIGKGRCGFPVVSDGTRWVGCGTITNLTGKYSIEGKISFQGKIFGNTLGEIELGDKYIPNPYSITPEGESIAHQYLCHVKESTNSWAIAECGGTAPSYFSDSRFGAVHKSMGNSTSLVVNSGFSFVDTSESDAFGWSEAEGHKRVAGGFGGSGGYSLEMVSGAGTTTSDAIFIKHDSSYVLSARVNNSISNGGVYVAVYNFNGSSNIELCKASTSNNHGEWEKISCSFSVSPTSDIVSVYVVIGTTGSGTGKVNVDNVGLNTMYCTDDFLFTPNLDDRSVTCTAAGFTWTGDNCCSEADDVYESYNDAGGIGACLMDTYQQNNTHTRLYGNVLNETFVYNGTIHGCAVDENNTNSEWIGDASKFNSIRTENKPYIGDNNYMLDWDDCPNPGTGAACASQNNNALVIDHAYCDIVGDVQNSQQYCSYKEVWEPTNGAPDNYANLSYLPAANFAVPSTVHNITQYAGCCPQNSCWFGAPYEAGSLSARCIYAQDTADTTGSSFYTTTSNLNNYYYPHPYSVDPLNAGDGYRCISGDWTWSTNKTNWDHSKWGYCPSDDMCFVDSAGVYALYNSTLGIYTPVNRTGWDGNAVTPQCVKPGEFIGDHYCFQGEWTTRTAILADDMLGAVANVNVDHVILCDSYSNVSNYLNYPVVPDSGVQGGGTGGQYNIDEGYFKKYITSGVNGVEFIPCKARDGTTVDCVNNFCVLYTGGKVSVGTTLNQDVNEQFGILTGLGEGSTICDGKGNSGFEKCTAASRGNVYYNRPLNAVVYSQDSFAQLSTFSQDKLLSWPVLYDSVLAAIRIAFTDYRPIEVTPDMAGMPLVDYIRPAYSKDFSTFYSAKQGGKEIVALIEKDIYIQGEPTDYLYINYSGFSGNICEALDKKMESVEMAGVGTGDDPPSHPYNCTVNGGAYEIVTRKRGPRANTIVDDLWQQLTSRLRI